MSERERDARSVTAIAMCMTRSVNCSLESLFNAIDCELRYPMVALGLALV